MISRCGFVLDISWNIIYLWQ